MPIYEYECLSCKAEFEELVRSTGESSGVQCPKCRGREVQRRLSVFAARGVSDPAKSSFPAAGPCGRCGDPRGSCQT